MKYLLRCILISFITLAQLSAFAAEDTVIYWNSEAGKILRSRISADSDYWQLSPWFAEQINQNYSAWNFNHYP